MQGDRRNLHATCYIDYAKHCNPHGNNATWYNSPMNETVFFYNIIGMHMHVHGKLKVGMCVTSKVHVGLEIYLHAPNRSAIVVIILVTIIITER